ncbi:MAG: gliding motility-associated C-terminal domain-containing protein [Bacteroidetes bacterium]|nr:MAG: gliding motility-associated C-terminal domain-containing protein [Bacteroidota bacterium]
MRLLILFLIISWAGKAAGQIWEEHFDNLPDGTTEVPARWSSKAVDCDDGAPGTTPGQSFWGVKDGRFLVNDIEGGPCCPGLGMGGGGRQNEWLSVPVYIGNYCNVGIQVTVFAEGNLECDAPNEPVFICTGLNPPDNSHDQVVAEFRTDGGDFEVFGYVCGSENAGVLSVSGLSGDSIQVRIRAANSANNEVYAFDDIRITGTLRVPTTFELPDQLCENEGPLPLPALSLEGIAGTWNFGEAFSTDGFTGSFATLQFTPFESECAEVFTDTIAVLPVPVSIFDTTICPFDSMEINGHFYGADTPDGLEIQVGEAASGCDSLIEMHLSLYPVSSFLIRDTLWEDESVRIGSETFYLGHPSGEVVFPGAGRYGCDSIVRVELMFIEREIYAPTAFSPNGDGLNEVWTLFGAPDVFQIKNLRIFDRWGGLVFEKSDLPPGAGQSGWDGRVKGQQAPGGIYIFLAEIGFADGRTRQISGDFLLIR